MTTELSVPSKDFSELSCYIVCPRKWYARHWLDLVSNRKSAAPTFGIWIHRALDVMFKSGWDLEAALDEWNKAELATDSLRTSALGIAILKAYHLEYVSSGVESLHNEVQWVVPVSIDGFEFTLHGRIDRIVKQHGLVWCMDHKTTTRLGATYFEQYNPNLQVALYMNASQEYFGDINGMIIDAIFVGKNRNFQRDPVALPKGELDLQFAEGLEWARRVISTERALKEHPDQWRTICPRAMITEACSSWSGCEYRPLCRWNFHEAIVEAEFHKEPWGLGIEPKENAPTNVQKKGATLTP